MKIKVEKRLYSEDIRKMCIANKYYTVGDNEQYRKMLTMCNSNNVTPRLIYRIADDIAMHSNFKMFQEQYGNITYGELLEHIMYQVNRCCYEFFKLESEV